MHTAMSRTALPVLVAIALLGGPAEARFGKRGSSGTSGGSSSGSSHSARPVGGGGSKSSGGSGGSSHSDGWAASHAGSLPVWRRGYFSGAFVPWYGYGYWVRPRAVCTSPGQVDVRRDLEREEEAWRLSASAELLLLLGTERGFTAALSAAAEADVFGVSLLAQNIAAVSKEGPGFDHLQQAALHGTAAFLRGRYGRLRAELGVDLIVAPDAIFVGPTGGLSGTLWLGGPVALEGNVLLTPFPFRQVDSRAALAVGIDGWGIKAGIRLQLLDDRGEVDGVTHRDVFWGPFVSLGVVL